MIEITVSLTYKFEYPGEDFTRAEAIIWAVEHFNEVVSAESWFGREDLDISIGNAEEEVLVGLGFACPDCGERRRDKLVWSENDVVVCQSCGCEYVP